METILKGGTSSLVPLSTYKMMGYEIKHLTTKKGFKGVELSMLGVKRVAIEAKGFEGKITLKTNLVEAFNNANPPKLSLYLTNKDSGVKVGEDVK